MVVPTYNERENVGPLIDGLLANGETIDVCVADDGSPDGTADARCGRPWPATRAASTSWSATRRAAAAPPSSPPSRRGSPIRSGTGISSRWTPTSPITRATSPKFLDKLGTCDMVIGSRYVDGGGTSDWGIARPILSWLANKYIGLVAGIPVRDTTSGYRGYRREVLEAAELRPHQDHRVRRPRRDGLPGLAERVPAGRGAHPLPQPAARRLKLTAEEIYMALLNFALLRRRYGKGRGAGRNPGRDLLTG